MRKVDSFIDFQVFEKYFVKDKKKSSPFQSMRDKNQFIVDLECFLLCSLKQAQ